MHIPRVYQAPAIAEPVRVVTFNVKAFLAAVLENRSGIIASLDQKFHGFSSQHRGIESVEENRAPTTLRMPDLPGEDGLLRRVPSAVTLKVGIPHHFDHARTQCFRGSAKRDVAGGVR